MNARREELENDIEDCKREIADKRQEIENFEPDEDAATDAFEEMLDDCYEPFRIGGAEYLPSRVLKEVDPTNYYCRLADYIDGIDLSDWPEYCELTYELVSLEEELEELEDELEELEDEEDEWIEREEWAEWEED